MSVIYRLDPPLPVVADGRRATAHAWIDYGSDYDLLWLVAYDDNNEFWILKNQHIRQMTNKTLRDDAEGELNH